MSVTRTALMMAILAPRHHPAVLLHRLVKRPGFRHRYRIFRCRLSHLRPRSGTTRPSRCTTIYCFSGYGRLVGQPFVETSRILPITRWRIASVASMSRDSAKKSLTLSRPRLGPHGDRGLGQVGQELAGSRSGDPLPSA